MTKDEEIRRLRDAIKWTRWTVEWIAATGADRGGKWCQDTAKSLLVGMDLDEALQGDE